MEPLNYAPTLTLADLAVLADTVTRNGRRGAFTIIAMEWAEQADLAIRLRDAEIARLQAEVAKRRNYPALAGPKA